MSTTNPNEPTGSNIFNFLPGTVSAPGVGFMNIGGISGGFFEISHNLSTRLITRRSTEGFVASNANGTGFIDSGNDRELDVAEFDDSLVDMAWWANPRYKGCKTTGKKINEYNGSEFISGIGTFQITDNPSPGTAGEPNNLIDPSLSSLGPPWTIGNYPGVETYSGDQTYGLNPVIQNESTAIYIANTVIGGEEDPQFATLQNHSYVGISKILIIDINSDTVDVIDRSTEGYEEFHRFITNDLATGTSFNMRVLDGSIATKLKAKYFCKMNKGWLLKTFDFRHAGEFSGSRQNDGKGCTATYDTDGNLGTNHENGTELTHCEDHLQTNNSMYFYRDGLETRDILITGSVNDAAQQLSQNPISGSRFRYAIINMFAGDQDGASDIFDQRHMGPNFVSSSILSNKYTRQFYSSSYGLIKNQFDIGDTNAERLANSDLGRASRFIGINCLDFLQQNNSNPSLTEEEKTEIHITFLQGVKDFSVSISGSGIAGNYKFNDSANDERSIGTFEVDQNQTSLDVGDHCHSFLPESHEITFKSAGDGRFNPNIDTFEDEFDNVYFQYTGSFLTFEQKQALASQDLSYAGCAAMGSSNPDGKGAPGTNSSRIDDGEIFIQGGALGAVGHIASVTSSLVAYRDSISGSMTVDNYYGGYVNSEGSASLDWQLSFLDKDHTLIADINKDEELFDGIGTRGIAIIPEFSHPKVKENLDLYLRKAGLIDSAPEGIINVRRE